MGIQIPEGSFLMVYRWTLDGDAEPQTTAMGFDVPFDPDLDTTTQFAYDHITDEDSLSDDQAMLGGWTFLGVTGYKQTSGGLEVFEVTLPIESGSASTAGITTNTCALIQKRTGLSGPGNRGRLYVPPFGVLETQVSQNGFYTGTQYADLTNRLNHWIAEWEAESFVPVLFHSDGGPATPITSLTYAPQVATQRRRMRG